MNITAISGKIDLPLPREKGAPQTTTAGRSAPEALHDAPAGPVKPPERDRSREIKPPEISAPEVFQLKAVFAHDEQNNVVIRFLDEKGRVVKQFPPEEYLNMVKKFQKNLESIFHNRV